MLQSDFEKQFCSEILLLWVTSFVTSKEVRLSLYILLQVSETYSKIINKLRFLIAYTSYLNPGSYALAYEELVSFDVFLLVILNILV
ncbi:isoleucyl-tRNA synthetase, partial [Streptococcus suis]